VQFFLFIGPTGKVNDKLFLAACFAFMPVTGHGNYISLAEMIVILYYMTVHCTVYIYDEGSRVTVIKQRYTQYLIMPE
jgi:hypothetical protein